MNIRKVPSLLYKRFKAVCAIEGKTIQDKVVELIEAASISMEKYNENKSN